jgi:hypothetical protein
MVFQKIVVAWSDPDTEDGKLHVVIQRSPATGWIDHCWFWSLEKHLKYEFSEGCGGIDGIRHHPKLTREQEDRILEEADEKWAEFVRLIPTG